MMLANWRELAEGCLISPVKFLSINMKRLTLLLALSLPALLWAASQEVDEIDAKTAEALSAADKAFPAGQDELNKKYLEALKKLEADRQKAGDLKSLLLVRDDLKLFEEKLEVNDGPGYPGLQFWREAYAQKFHQLKKDQLERHVALLEAHRATLDSLRKKMTQGNLIEDALAADQALQDFAPRLAQAREELKSWAAKTPAEVLGKNLKPQVAETPATPAPAGTDPKTPGAPDPFGPPLPEGTAKPADTAKAKRMTSGTAVAWGRPDFGQNDIPLNFREVSDVAAGWYHSVGLSPEGKVRTWGGRGFSGGEAKIEPVNPAILTVPADLPPAVGVAAGMSFSAARLADGTIRVWGVGEALEVPEAVKDVTDLQGGKDYLLALRSDGRIIVWGSEVKKYKLHVPEGLGKVKQISAGAFHIAVLTSDGQVRAWGDNTFDQCKVTGDFYYDKPTPGGGTSSMHDDIVQVAAGSEATYALGKSGHIYGWGGKEFNQMKIPEGNSFILLEAGDRFCAAVTKVGKVVVWGTKQYPLTPDGKAQDVMKLSALNDQILGISSPDNSGSNFLDRWKKWNNR